MISTNAFGRTDRIAKNQLNDQSRNSTIFNEVITWFSRQPIKLLNSADAFRQNTFRWHKNLCESIINSYRFDPTYLIHVRHRGVFVFIHLDERKSFGF